MSKLFAPIMGKSSLSIFVKGGATILVLLLIGYLVKSLDFENIFNTVGFGQEGHFSYWNGPFAYILLATCFICIGAPRQIISFFAAFFFGFKLGLLAALLATTCGCVISYSIGRIFNGYFQDFVKGKLDIALTFWRENTFWSTVIWRFLPVGNNLITNLAAGAFKIPPVSFISGSAVGYIPQTLVFVVLGTGVNLESGTQILISIVLFAVSALMGLYLFSRYRKQIRTQS